MAKIIGIIAGLSVFGVWMNIVGNPHVVETVIGLIVGIAAGIWVYKQAAKFKKTKQRSSLPVKRDVR